MKTMPRILSLLFCLSFVTMLYITKFGLYIDSHFNQGNLQERSSKQPMDRTFVVSENVERKYQNEVQTLQLKIQKLEKALELSKEESQNLTSRISEQSLIIRTLQEYKGYSKVQNVSGTANYSIFIEEKIQNSEILHGVQLNNEYELIPFTKFTLHRIFLVEPGLGKRVVEKPIGYKRKDIFEVVLFAVDELNKDRADKKRYSVDEFIEGAYRTDPTSGSHYELFFRSLDKPGKNSYLKVSIFKPFGILHNLETIYRNTSMEWINLVLPLSGRIDAFQQFMSRFIRVCIKQDKKVFLTVVYFGTEGLEEVKQILTTTAKEFQYKHIKLVTLNEEFSRGRGLQVGVLSWKQGDVLLFLCDVDIVFTMDFLERCRLNSIQGKRVYYPIVFSLYNPNIVYSLQDMKIPPQREQLVISRSTGFWRDFGYGMTCQYRSDFLSVQGFNEYITGWGGEDVFLYQKYIHSDYFVVRATDPSIFHLWHEKKCDPNLSSDQYRSCIRSKALSEASHAQLGLLAFKDEVDMHRSLVKQKH
ncbi:hypothetical protein CHS0354_017140 [Potamilus streckersoni]|uniref:Hexosyltransferase n=1 Tax=Potamilus streckersoni TaxID=2493646 RepID=A0AAE0TEK1_9BIVA|nr:hypothetical protein CHS0354_017140 [Potamilus streckersoni]